MYILWVEISRSYELVIFGTLEMKNLSPDQFSIAMKYLEITHEEIFSYFQGCTMPSYTYQRVQVG